PRLRRPARPPPAPAPAGGHGRGWGDRGGGPAPRPPAQAVPRDDPDHGPPPPLRRLAGRPGAGLALHPDPPGPGGDRPLVRGAGPGRPAPAPAARRRAPQGPAARAGRVAVRTPNRTRAGAEPLSHLLETDVVVVGGGVTGVAVLRDLALRGVHAVLVERFDLGTGTSGRWHGLLHSG